MLDLFQRRGAPETSGEAAASLVPHVARLEARVLAAFRASGDWTCDALEVQLGMAHTTCSARIRALVLKGLLRDSGERQRTRAGRNAVVWTAR